jgi:hypothetical protein
MSGRDPMGAAVRRAECQAVELRHERGDAERRLGELHARRAALVAGSDDGMLAEALADIDSQIRSAADRLRIVHVWGVDPAADRLAFAFAEVGSEVIEVETVRTGSSATEGERLGWLDLRSPACGRVPAGVCVGGAAEREVPQLDVDLRGGRDPGRAV